MEKLVLDVFDLADALELLDAQRAHAVRMGAKFEVGQLFIGDYALGNPAQNCYYDGHLNMMQRLLIGSDYAIDVDAEGKHYFRRLTA